MCSQHMIHAFSIRSVCANQMICAEEIKDFVFQRNDLCIAPCQSEYPRASRKELLPRLPLLRLKTGLERPDPEDSDTSQLLERLGITPRRYLHHRRNYCVYMIARTVLFTSSQEPLCVPHRKKHCVCIMKTIVLHTSSKELLCMHRHKDCFIHITTGRVLYA